MLVQDTLTGALHDVPDVAGYGYYGEPENVGELYDGFGNPVGFLPFLAPLAAKVLPALTNAIPGVGQLIGNLLPGGGAPPAPPVPGLPVPPGWMHRPNPYTGLTPHRRYMRCVSWPGPPGLVPISAANTPQPAQAAVVAAATAPLARHRFRRRR